ncbi:hypothetical protein MQX03_15535 [Chryseobacterium aahli]|uniref:helix-turn-helix transcriptional regulator n=1 Tax=Chryseobacterium aahli TaxID=1278643 RepID=UPI001F603188|nr:hypothetical protein [Chryseobacterium aahli]MCI3938611.1 hypothetical protein [Chryseobacterium aahli]
MKSNNSNKKDLFSEKQDDIDRLENEIDSSFEAIVSLAKANSPNFLARFQDVYPHFCNKITEIYPEINNTELIFCAYLRLNFSSKEIANYTFVTPKTIQMKKYRLRKKLSIPSDQDINIWMYKL